MLACYTRNRLVPEALSLFQEMEERQLPLDAYTYSNMINACVKGQLGLGKALQLFDRWVSSPFNWRLPENCELLAGVK